MNDTTIKVIMESLPATLAAIFAGAATIISTLSLRKSTQNGKKADVANEKADAANFKADIIVQKTQDIHEATNGNFTRVKEELELANEALARLAALDDSRIVSILQRHQTVLTRMDTDLVRISFEVRQVRDRQHDMANYLTQSGMRYELKPIPKEPTGD